MATTSLSPLEELAAIDAALLDGTATEAQEQRGLQLVALLDASHLMLNALECAETPLSEYCASDDGRDRDAQRALQRVRAAIRAGKGGDI
jgi:hypothetical protein